MSTSTPPAADPVVTSEAPPPKERGAVNLQAILSRLDAAEKAAAEREKRLVDQLGEVSQKLDAANLRAETLLGRLDTLAHHFLALQAVVRASLPSQLLRLSPEHLRELAEKAPNTRIRLLAPLKGPNLNLAEGLVLPVSDRRVEVYMTVIQAALVVADSDDVAVHVKQIIAAEAAAVIAAADEQAKAEAATQADTLQAEADRLRAGAGK